MELTLKSSSMLDTSNYVFTLDQQKYGKNLPRLKQRGFDTNGREQK